MKKEVLNNSFVFYATNLEVIETLEETDKELANEFMKAIIEYGIYGEYENTNPIIKVLMVQAGFGIDKAKDRYATAVENGKKGGRPKTVDEDKVRELKGQGLTNKQIAEELKCSVSSVEKINAKNRKNRKNLNDNVNVNVNVNVNDNENVNINENEKKSFGLQANQNSEDADGTISKCAEGTISECGAQFQNVSSAQSENVYNIKEINNNNKKEIDKWDFVAIPVRKNELPTPQMRNTNSAKTNLEVRKNDREIDIIDIIDNNINNIDIGDFVASQQNPATPLATQVGSVRQVEAVGADKVITINCSDMRDSYYHLYKYLAKYQPALASFVVNGIAFCRSNKERTDKAIEICNTYGYTINFNDTAAAVANV